MAYDELLAMRIRDVLGDLKGLSEKRMMGGVCFLVDGNMVCGADRTKQGVRRFMFRLGKNNPAVAKLSGGGVVAMGERVMPGFYFVDSDVCGDRELKAWVDAALAYTGSLPPKA